MRNRLGAAAADHRSKVEDLSARGAFWALAAGGRGRRRRDKRRCSWGIVLWCGLPGVLIRVAERRISLHEATLVRKPCGAGDRQGAVVRRRQRARCDTRLEGPVRGAGRGGRNRAGPDGICWHCRRTSAWRWRIGTDGTGGLHEGRRLGVVWTSERLRFNVQRLPVSDARDCDQT